MIGLGGTVLVSGPLSWPRSRAPLRPRGGLLGRGGELLCRGVAMLGRDVVC